MYLSLITDAYSKKNVGYNLPSTLETAQSIKALKQALKKRQYPQNQLIHHSDRGLQYCSDNYQKLLNKNNVKCNMTHIKMLLNSVLMVF